MATTPRGDSEAVRRMVVRNLARRIVQQRTGAGTEVPAVTKSPRRMTARPVPLRQGTPVR